MRNLSRILLVEDDDFTRFMMREIINTLGVEVDVAENGDIGCTQLERAPDTYSLVLMDIHMAHMSGVDAARRIRASKEDPPRNVAIVAVTADEDYHDDSVVGALGMNGYIAKPVTPGELMGLIDRYCV